MLVIIVVLDKVHISIHVLNMIMLKLFSGNYRSYNKENK